MTQLSGLEKSTPPHKVLKDTTGMRYHAGQRRVRPKLKVDEQHQASKIPINALRIKGLAMSPFSFLMDAHEDLMFAYEFTMKFTHHFAYHR